MVGIVFWVGIDFVVVDEVEVDVFSYFYDEVLVKVVSVGMCVLRVGFG